MFFQRTVLMEHPTGCRDSRIAPNQEIQMKISIPQRDFPVTKALRIIGETDEFWKWRADRGNPYWLFESVEDALFRDELPDENFCLKISGHGEAFERNAYMLLKKGSFQPGKPYAFSVTARSRDLALEKDGEAVCELGIYRKKEGRAEDDVFDLPDEVIRLDLPQGDSAWKKLGREFVMPEDAVCLLVRIGFCKACGEASFGSPTLLAPGEDTAIPPFDTYQTRYPEYNWLGENLDRRERPVFRISIDGKEVFYGEKYNAIYRRPEFTITIPDLPPGEHSLTIRLEADYPAAVGFLLLGVELLEEGAECFEVIASPEFFPEHTPCPVLIRTNEDKITISGTTFCGRGDHVLILPPMEAGPDRSMEVSSGSCRKVIRIKAVIAGKPDGLLLSTGDTIFIPQTPEEYMRYLEWYLSCHIGNAMRFRCCYRWSGSRIFNRETWDRIIPLLNELNMDYAVMMDGRELPGKHGNPPEELVAGPHYLGRQAHENDGGLFYWGNRISKQPEPPMPHGDLLARGIDYGGIRPHIRPVRRDGHIWRYFDPADASDMAEAAGKFVENLKKIKGSSTRHSGPSALFRYFFQAGYKYLEAELMYASEEVTLSALRGASRTYGQREFGAHLATQWSSLPLNTPDHAERYWLSLCCCYMQGGTQFNIEEGLWRMENGYADYDRFSDTCLLHLEAHTRFRRFMETHRRRGNLIAPTGIVQGRFDNWSAYVRDNLWQRKGDFWKFGEPENSFDLLRVFFPRSRFSYVKANPCTQEPHGWYTGTPYGSVDLFPLEGEFSWYKNIIFLGWNTFETEDGKKMLDFVRGGGNLLFAKAHLSASTDRLAGVCIKKTPELDELLGEGWENAVHTIRRNVGKGSVICYPGESYPAAFAEEYTADMRSLARKAAAREYQHGWIESNEDVSFSVFEDEKTALRRIYLLNIRWWDRKSSAVKLYFDGHTYDVSVPYGQLFVLTIAGNCAWLPENPLADLFLSDETGTLLLQSPEEGSLHIFSSGNHTVRKFPAGITSPDAL